MKFILAHKKKIAVAILALLGALIAVLEVVPGDQKEASLRGIHEKAAGLVEKLPPDADQAEAAQ